VDAVNRRPAVPKLVLAVRRYAWATLWPDLGAGVTVGLVSLPLAMAFAIASGLPPDTGIACAVAAGVVTSLCGGSSVQIGGPTGAFLIVAAGLVATHGAGALGLCTLMGGLLLVGLGLAGMGDALRFVPRPIVVGLTNGIAILIATTQLRELLGLTMARMPGDFPGRMAAIGGALGTTDAVTAVLAAATLLLLILCHTLRTRIPGPIVALVAGTAAAHLLGLNVATIDTRFHGLASPWPGLGLSAFRPDLVLGLLPAAFTLAIVSGLESVTAATAADRLTGDRHNPNVELVAQGAANLASTLVGGLPAAGSMARTMANVRAGGRTPIAGLGCAVTLVILLAGAAPLVALVPMPVLAAIVAMITASAGDWAAIPDQFRAGPLDATAWAITLALTLFADLTEAVPLALAIGALLFIRRVSTTTDVARVIDEDAARHPVDLLPDKEVPPFVAAFRATGPLLFGGTDALDAIRDRLDGLPPIVILRLRYLTALDAAGLDAIEDLARTVTATSRVFLLAGARDQPLALMRRTQFARRLGADRICASFEDALARAREIHAARFSGAWPNVGAPLTSPEDTRPESGDEPAAIPHDRAS
jgi:SulP family sulfate permease